jgi:hypothetical protein
VQQLLSRACMGCVDAPVQGLLSGYLCPRGLFRMQAETFVHRKRLLCSILRLSESLQHAEAKNLVVGRAESVLVGGQVRHFLLPASIYRCMHRPHASTSPVYGCTRILLRLCGLFSAEMHSICRFAVRGDDGPSILKSHTLNP